jgi:crotonobetainyl-CoA:carnitine CoA-transferase CaiB-like acyl-CoA transferase
MSAPLDGIRVVEVANWLAVPATGAMMADMGADVIKVEAPGGDPYRATTVKIGYDVPFATNWGFQLDNRGKRSVTIDLDKDGGIDLVLELVKTADILITNLLPERRDRYGLGFAAVRSVHPRIVYVLLTGYGSDGPDAWRPGFDHAAFWAASGVMGLLGQPHEPPPDCRSGQGDHTTALNLLAASLAALRMRDASGEAQFVETALQATGMWTIASDYASALASGIDPGRPLRAVPRHPVSNHFQCGDGRWIQFAMPKPFPGYWPRFCQAIGRPEWAEAGTGATNLDELRARTVEWVAEIDAIIATKSLAEWAEIFDAHGIIWAPVATLTEVAASDQVRHMGWVARLEHPQLGAFETLSTPFRLHGAEIGPRAAAPEPGQHTSAVVSELGLDDVKVADLAARGVFG